MTRPRSNDVDLCPECGEELEDPTDYEVVEVIASASASRQVGRRLRQ